MRVAGIAWVLVFLAWIPFEDTQPWLALGLAAAGVVWLALKLRVDWQAANWFAAAAWGAALGAAVPLAGVALMAFKGGIHAHGFADFSARQLLGVMALLPICVAGGMGLALRTKSVLSAE